MRCLEKEPAARYDSAADLQRALTAVAVPSTSFKFQRAALAGAAVAILIGVVGLGARSYVQASRVRWVEEKAVPEISRLINENRRLAALTLFQEAQRYAPGSRKLFAVEEGVAIHTRHVSFVAARRPHLHFRLCGRGRRQSGRVAAGWGNAGRHRPDPSLGLLPGPGDEARVCLGRADVFLRSSLAPTSTDPARAGPGAIRHGLGSCGSRDQSSATGEAP